jgi:hypothetical protein
MRLPIVLTLLVLFLLPADLNSFAATLNTQYGAATSAIAGFFDRNEDDDSTIEVASVPRREITPGTAIR